MPIKLNTNNRIIPANTRVADVAKSAIDILAPVQRLKYHQAFIPQGFEAVVYHRLSSGTRCACHAKVAALKTRLNEKGDGDEAFVNEMLTGLEFGVVPYAVRTATQLGSKVLSESLFTVDESEITQEDRPDLPSLWEDDAPGYEPGIIGSASDHWTTNSNEITGSGIGTIVEDGVGPRGPVDTLEEVLPQAFDDSFGMGVTDRACPVCFGTNWVGGFSVYNGWRQVLNFQWPNANLADGIVNTELFTPSVTSSSASFSITLPNHAVGVDALNCRNGNNTVSATFFVDGQLLNNPRDLIPFCDGGVHTLNVMFSDLTEWTHIELQVNQSTTLAYLEFPKLQKGSVQDKIESLQDFNLVVSPIVPLIRPNDVVAESTYGKVLHIKSSNWWNDKRWVIHGWECEVRPVQPSELYNLLPRRSPLHSPKTPALARDNSTGYRRV